MKKTPYFEDGYDLLRWRDYLLEEQRAGRIDLKTYRRRVRLACEHYRRDSESREYYRRIARDRAHATEFQA